MTSSKGATERAKELGYALSDPFDTYTVLADGTIINARTGKVADKQQ